jgi:DNA-binding MarR family transcriptional regulator
MKQYRNLITIQFDQAQQPKFEEKKAQGYVEFGEKNNYPNYLIDLYNESPKHGAIVKGKVNYIYGKGFKDVPRTANTEGDSWNTLLKRCIQDDQLHGGYYLQIVYNALGNIANVFHIPFQKVRVSKDLRKFYVKDDWEVSNYKEKPRCYDAYNPNDKTGSQILYIKQYNPFSDVYPVPDYFQALNYVLSDIYISRHILGNAKHNFVATKLINFNNGLPQEEEQEQVELDMKKKFANHDGDRFVLSFNPSKENGIDIVDLGQTSLTKEDFTNVNNLVQQEIFAGHQITSPMLFGIKTEGQLGGRTEIRDAYEIFNNTFVNERQQAHEQVFNKLMNLAGVTGEWKIIPVEPLGFEFTEAVMAANMTRNEIREKLGLAPDVADASGSTQAMQGNDALVNITGRQQQALLRISRLFTNGKLTKQQAVIQLRAFGFTDEQINQYLGVDDNPQTNDFAAIEDDILLNEFASCGDDVNDFNIIEKKNYEKFQEIEAPTKLEANILELLNKDKRITNETIASTLKVPLDIVTKTIADMVALGLIAVSTAALGTVERSLTKPIEKIIGNIKPSITQVLLRYTYSGPEDSRNRPFCARMLQLSKTKLWSRQDIENISLRLGYSVWDRRGGWWTMPDGKHSPSCRHDWDEVIVTKKK